MRMHACTLTLTIGGLCIWYLVGSPIQVDRRKRARSAPGLDLKLSFSSFCDFSVFCLFLITFCCWGPRGGSGS